MELGIPEVSDTLERLGVDKNEIRPVPSMFLGSFSLTPFEVAQMYQTVTNSGKRAKLSALRSVIDMDGNVIYQSLPRSAQAVDQQAAWLTTYAMKQGVAQGTGRFLQSQFSWAALAGKTGTSNDSRDSWFVGVDGREVTTVWLGRDDNKSTKLTGSSGALRVYAEYLQQRIPERLELPWPKEVTTLGFQKAANGALELNCRSEYKLPVWDKTGQIKQQCEKKSNWLNNLFDW
jgi:penicillin-binding protein 1B